MRSSPSGGQIMALRSQGATFRAGRWARKNWRPAAEADPRINSCIQAAFLAFGGGAFVGFGASFAFSLAANSCLTLRLMASTSTL